MPNATLTFSLPEEQDEFRRAVDALKYYCAISDLREAFRQKDKYASDEGATTWHEARELLVSVLSDAGVEID